MIRFIDLGKQIGLDDEWPREFAFYDTITDRFIGHGDSQTWASWDDLTVSAKYVPEFLTRVKPLCPEWVFTAKFSWNDLVDWEK